MDKLLIESDSTEVIFLKQRDKRLAKIIDYFGDLECNQNYDPYVFIVYQIVGQMLSNRVADILIERLVNLCDGIVSIDSINHLSKEELKSIGISSAKCEYIKGFTDAVLNGDIDFSKMDSLTDDMIIKQLTSVKGIGNWTAKMYMLFVLQRPNILPYEDAAFLQGFKWLYKTDMTDRATVEKKCKKWKPYSSMAARYVYRATDAGLINYPFHLYKELRG